MVCRFAYLVNEVSQSKATLPDNNTQKVESCICATLLANNASIKEQKKAQRGARELTY